MMTNGGHPHRQSRHHYSGFMADGISFGGRRASDPAADALAIVAVLLAEALVEMRLLALDGELLREKGGDNAEEDEPEHSGRKPDADHEERIAEIDRVARDGIGAVLDQALRRPVEPDGG